LNVDAAGAIIMLAGVYYGSMYGGTITSVMLKVPGEASTVVTVLDGYPMASQGRAASALGIAAIGSLFGGIVAVIGIALLAPQMAQFALSMGSAALTGVALLGLVLVAYVGTKSTVKSLAMASVGLLLATVGLDPFTGGPRLNFGILELTSGIDIVVLTVGLLGVSELLRLLSRRDTQIDKLAPLAKVGKTVLPTRDDFKQSKWAIGRGSILGFFLGLVPGGGGVLSSLASYAVERRLAKDPSRFGKGAIEGVAGPETANNAASQSAFVPLLTLGLPSNSVLAVIYGALLLQGVTPGPSLITNHPDVFWGVLASMLVGNVILVVLNIYFIRVWVKLLRIPTHYLVPVAMAVIVVSIFAINNSMFDVALVFLFGLIGWVLNKFGLEPSPLVLGFVLGKILEVNIRRALVVGDGGIGVFLEDPVSAVALSIIAVLLIARVTASLRARSARKTTV
jgi:putative tricarboxylic transport membrane protein